MTTIVGALSRILASPAFVHLLVTAVEIHVFKDGQRITREFKNEKYTDKKPPYVNITKKEWSVDELVQAVRGSYAQDSLGEEGIDATSVNSNPHYTFWGTGVKFQ